MPISKTPKSPKKTKKYHYLGFSSDEGFGSRPTNYLSPERLVAGKDAWRKLEGEQKPEQMSLIIHDPRVMEWGRRKKIIVAERLLALMNQGFNLYVYHGSQLEKLEQKDLTAIESNIGNAPISDKRLKEKAIKEQNLSHDQLHVLNAEQIDLLMNGDDEDWEDCTSIADLSNSNLNINSLNRLLLAKRDSLTHLNLSGCINLGDGSIPEGIQLPQLDSLILNKGSYSLLRNDISSSEERSPSLNKESVQRLIKSAPNLKYLDLSGYEHIDDLLDLIPYPEKLETLILSKIDSASVMSLLGKTTHLKNLNLAHVKSGLSTLHQHLDARELEELTLTQAKINSHSLNQILSQAKQLKKLKLYSNGSLDTLGEELRLEHLEELCCSAPPTSIPLNKILGKAAQSNRLKKLELLGFTKLDAETFKGVNFQNLEHLDLSGSSINSDLLTNILSSAPNLKSLILCNSYNLGEYLKFDSNLPKLESLILANSDVEAEFLGHLLAKTLALKELNLDNCQNLSEEMLGDYQLPELTALNLTSSNITADVLGKFLAKTPNLKILKLVDCPLSEQLFTEFNLPFLEEIELGDPNINADSLAKILAKAPNLKKITFNGCTIGDEFNHDFQLPALQMLVTKSESTISTQGLKHFLDRAPNIEEIELRMSNQQNGAFVEYPLTSLKDLILYDADFSTDALKNVFAKTPNLRNLKLRSSKGLQNELTIDSTLPSLRTLDLTYSDITLPNLAKILAKTPHLHKLALDDCKNLKGDLGESFHLPELYVLSLYSAPLSAESLTCILAKTPNLKTLNLNSATNLSGTEFQDFNLPELLELNAALSNISPALLSKILIKAPQLHTLSLNGCEQVTELLLEDQTFPALRDLNLSHGKLNAVSLNKILTKTPNLSHLDASNSLINIELLANLPAAATLKHLTLQYCNNLAGDISPEVSFPDLISLITSYSNLSPDALLHIIKNAPLLRSVGLPDGTSLLGEELKNITLEKLKTHCKPKPTPSFLDSLYRPRSSGVGIKLPSGKTHTVDAQTSPSDTPLEATKVFYGYFRINDPDVSLYRLQTYNTMTVNTNPCGIDSAFSLSNDSDELQLSADKEPKRQDKDTWTSYKSLPHLTSPDRFYYGKQVVQVTAKWQPIASLSANEVMTDYHLSNSAAQVDIQYSKRDNLYYIRKKEGVSQSNQQIEIDFIVKIPKPHKTNLPQDIVDKINQCKNFGKKELPPFSGNLKGEDYLKALIKNEVGACRHRAVVMKHWMQENHPEIPTRVINNDCHSFIELFYNQQWHHYNLGGYPGELKINTLHKRDNDDTEVTVSATLNEQGGIVAGSPKQSYFTQAKPEKQPVSSLQYMQSILGSDAKRQLIKLPDSETISAVRFGLDEYCKNINRPYYYIHSPEDLICSAAFIQRKKNKGTLVKGPGGPLHDFLIQHKDANPVIVVNYDLFTPNDIVRFNALLDVNRKADGTDLPKEAMVIGLINPDKSNAYNGRDFYSRFDAPPQYCPYGKEFFPKPIAISEHKQGNKEPYIIDLFGGNDWEERLLGHWEVSGKQLTFVEGALSKALKENASIQLNNAPWHNERFKRFWQETLFHKQIKTRYETHKLPKKFTLSKGEGYPWEQLTKSLNFTPNATITQKTMLLNPTTLSHFLSQYTCDNQTQTIHHDRGLLEQHQGKTIPIYLSAPLSKNSWALLLDTCKKYKVKLNLRIAPEVTLPSEFPEIKPQGFPPNAPWFGTTLPNKDFALHTTDVDFTLHQLKAPVMIDVSEIEPGNLLKKIKADFNKDTLDFTFTEQEGALLTALEENKTVILHGQFSAELKDSLNALLLHRQHHNVQGQIILVSNEPHLSPLLTTYEHPVSAEEKKQAIEDQVSLFSQTDYEHYDFVTLQTIQAYHRMHPNEPTNNSWRGMKELPKSVHTPLIDLSQAKLLSEAFMQQRIHAVEKGLEHVPYVFLAGKTGVGKTTFILEQWKSKYPAVHMGEDKMVAWAVDKTPGIKTLFIDEANITKRQWSEFEGLFRTPPGMMINNKYYPLTPEHKVIFAGNPLSYGGERTLPSLFTRHGNSIIFDPIPPAVIYQDVLTPLLKGFDPAIAHPILKVEQILSEFSTDKVLVTPRELSMMALLTVSYCRDYPEGNPLNVANYYAYQIGKHLVPEEHLASFKKQWGEIPTLDRSYDLSPTKFKVNTTNRPIVEVLNDNLKLRALRQLPENAHLAQGGLGGVIIEGAPGNGKSDLAIKMLLAFGLKKGDVEKAHPNEQVFYQMPVSMPLAEKKELLLKAFHEGAVIMIDEINSAPMMERLLNDLLMGKTPEGLPAKKPGFMVIGTQNPPTMAGRTATSLPLKRRLHTSILQDYTPTEMIDILMDKELSRKKATTLVKEYLHKRQQNTAVDESEMLCFRDVIKRADTMAEHLGRAERLLKLKENRLQQLRAVQFDQRLQEIKQKSTQLLNDGYTVAGQDAENLYVQLVYYKNNYLNELTELDEFKAQCIDSLNEAKEGELKNHRLFFRKLGQLMNINLPDTSSVVLINKISTVTQNIQDNDDNDDNEEASPQPSA